MSHFDSFSFSIVSPHFRPEWVTIGTGGGQIALQIATEYGLPRYFRHWGFGPTAWESGDGIQGFSAESLGGWSGLRGSRFAIGVVKVFDGTTEYHLIVPLWFLLIALLVPPTWWFYAFLRRRQKGHIGICHNCGYDLRHARPLP